MPDSRCDGAQLWEQRPAETGVDRRQRFVQQQHAWMGDQRAGEGHELLLSGRQR